MNEILISNEYCDFNNSLLQYLPYFIIKHKLDLIDLQRESLKNRLEIFVRFIPILRLSILREIICAYRINNNNVKRIQLLLISIN